ncbi:zinc finger protein [Gloeophyllum trabeum ATCC 11539]|uniref:protein acetyllysine N-acetyltransferase n=1 Tax=Gloeophyllum trabeum (strain ATCC 11539 / FP-39264 / Madison 617) TaxID=670483 RepID=S7PUE3_GLOTA|nr:zinc finger protein [Gloeophyllum trabeum ATCC 11539]EPQ51431.1 zinc finger protein [Gloeophyllum trabeum ATCC 11539]
MISNKCGTTSQDEHPDPPDVLQAKIKTLARLVKQSHSAVVFTGAGISTSAGIPDFRGPQGLWTLQSQGVKSPLPLLHVSPTPTLSHMAIARLIKLGKLSCVVSQNIDGLHGRSGIPSARLAEVHGSVGVDVCTGCEKRYQNTGIDAARLIELLSCALDPPGPSNLETERSCTACGGRLRSSVVAFGDALPAAELAKASRFTAQADLGIVLGSSLRVAPFTTLPRSLARARRPLVIVNMQRTPLDVVAALRIGGSTDEVMEGVMRELGEEVPEWGA